MVTRRVSPRKTTLCEVIVINSGNFIGQFYNWTLNIHHWTLGCPRIVFFNLAIFRHVGNDLNVPLEVSLMHQTIKGDPKDGWDELKPDQSYLSHFPPWYSKNEIPIENKKCPHNNGYGSTILKIVLWAHFTITHAVLSQSTEILKKKKNYSGTPYWTLIIESWSNKKKSSVTLWLVPNEPIVSCYSYSNDWQDVSPGGDNGDDDDGDDGHDGDDDDVQKAGSLTSLRAPATAPPSSCY